MVADTYQQNSTVIAHIEPESVTNPHSARRRPRPSDERTTALIRRSSRQTVPYIDPLEQGQEDERNSASDSGTIEAAVPEEEPVDHSEGARLRSEMAGDLIRRVDKLLPLIGDLSLATQINLLKRDLSKSHDVLRPHPAEGDFLSIVTLVESAISQLKWKQYTKEQLTLIRSALEIGYRQVRVTHGDLLKARRDLTAKGVESTPTVDLESLKWGDLDDVGESADGHHA